MLNHGGIFFFFLENISKWQLSSWVELTDAHASQPKWGLCEKPSGYTDRQRQCCHNPHHLDQQARLTGINLDSRAVYVVKNGILESVEYNDSVRFHDLGESSAPKMCFLNVLCLPGNVLGLRWEASSMISLTTWSSLTLSRENTGSMNNQRSNHVVLSAVKEVDGAEIGPHREEGQGVSNIYAKSSPILLISNWVDI